MRVWAWEIFGKIYWSHWSQNFGIKFTYFTFFIKYSGVSISSFKDRIFFWILNRFCHPFLCSTYTLVDLYGNTVISNFVNKLIIVKVANDKANCPNFSSQITNRRGLLTYTWLVANLSFYLIHCLFFSCHHILTKRPRAL